MSHFSDVDASPSPAALERYLEGTDRFLAAMKAYMATAASRAVRDGLVVDVGCGLGRDLTRLADLGVRAIGLDLSVALLARASAAGSPLVQGDAAALPFRTSSLDGCRVERVLEHVAEPTAVIDEIVRVLRPGGLVLAFEPDFSTFRVDSDVVADGSLPASLMRARHPAIGGTLASMLEQRGFRIHDVVTESSRGYGLELLPVHAEAILDRAVADGRCAESLAARWLEEQRGRTARGTFRAKWDKVLVVATNTKKT